MFPTDKYPYTNFHELNLAYFITHFREIFSQWADLYDQMLNWKNATDEELATWKAGVEADLDQREEALRAELKTWKAQTGQDIAGWEDATLAALTAWQTATQAVFEAIRVEAAGSATAAAASAEDAATAKTAAETAQAAAEAAAASVQASAAQIAANTADIAALQSQVADINTIIGSEPEIIDDLSGYTLHNGNINNSNAWNNVNDSYKHIVIPITRHPATLSLTGGNTTGAIAAVKSYTEPVGGTPITPPAPDFSADSADPNWTQKVDINANRPQGPYTLPLDANYLIVMMMRGGTTNCTPVVFNLVLGEADGLVEDVSQLSARMNTAETDIAENNAAISDLDSRVDTLEATAAMYERSDLTGLSDHTGNIGTGANAGTWRNINDNNYKYVIVPAMGGMLLQAGLSANGLRMAILRDYVIPGSSGDPILYSTDEKWNSIKINSNTPLVGILPDDAKYIAVMTLYNGNDTTPSSFSLTPKLSTQIHWCAMGDSITAGYYSAYDGAGGAGQSHNVPTLTWAYQVGVINKWALHNMAVGGTGYLDKENTNPPPEPEDDTSCGYYKARHTDFTPYDLVTVAYGINDWKANLPIGVVDEEVEPGQTKDKDKLYPTTVLGAMEATIEGIMASNPACKIIIILPLNIWDQYSANPGSKDTLYARGYTGFTNMPSLDEFSEKMIEVCDMYGVQYIDLTKHSVLNIENMVTMLPDGVHPSLRAHDLLAKELAKKITF